MLWCGGVWDISFPYTIEPFLTPTPSERRETALVNTICSWPGAALVLYGAQRSHRTDTCSPVQNHPSPLTPPRCWMYHRAAPAPRNCVRVLLLCHPWAAGTALHSPQQSLQQWQGSWITSQAGDLSLLSLSITFIKSCRRSLPTMHTGFFSVCSGSPLALQSHFPHMQRSLWLMHTPLSISAFLSTGWNQITQAWSQLNYGFQQIFPCYNNFNQQSRFLS